MESVPIGLWLVNSQMDDMRRIYTTLRDGLSVQIR